MPNLTDAFLAFALALVVVWISTPVVKSLVKERKKSVKGNICCHGKNAKLGHGHASIAYEVRVEYSRISK